MDSVRLAHLGRRSYVSESGLAAILKELHTEGELPTAISRTSIKRARQKNIHINTIYGPVLRTMDMTLGAPGETRPLAYIHPIAMLYHAASSCNAFGSYIGGLLSASPSTPSSRWSIVIYSDEVLPGNALKHDNRRKLQAIYWSLMQLGPTWLAAEASWFVLATVRSNLVTQLPGGMSNLLRMLISTFFEETSDVYNGGITLHTPAGTHMFFATMGVMVSDESALKQSFQMKGASGTMLCMACQNIVSHTANLHQRDVTGFLVASTETDTRRFVLHTDSSIRNTVKSLRDKQATMSKSAFAKLEQAMGFNLCPEGLLLCPKLEPMIAPISMLMYDWMHTFVVNGIFQNEMGQLLHLLHNVAKISHTEVHKFVSSFTWPSHLSTSVSGAAIFEKRSQSTGDFKCSGSEALSVFGVFSLFLMMHVLPGACNAIKLACDSYFRLCRVLTMLMSIPRGCISDASLSDAISSHLRAFVRAYGDGAWTPKFHYSLHLPAMLRRHGCLVSCFVHERKHKEIKRYANNITNTSGAFESSILESSLYLHLEILADAKSLPNATTHLINPRPAPQKLAAAVRHELQTQAEVLTATQAIYKPLQKCSRRDVVLVSINDQSCIAEICFHVEVDGLCLTCVSPWSSLGSNRFRIETEPVLIPTRHILETCIYCRMGPDAVVVPV